MSLLKVTDEDLLSEVVAINRDREDGQYYNIIPVPPGDHMAFNNTKVSAQTPDSQLYRLLTTEENGKCGHLLTVMYTKLQR